MLTLSQEDTYLVITFTIIDSFILSFFAKSNIIIITIDTRNEKATIAVQLATDKEVGIYTLQMYALHISKHCQLLIEKRGVIEDNYWCQLQDNVYYLFSTAEEILIKYTKEWDSITRGK